VPRLGWIGGIETVLDEGQETHDNIFLALFFCGSASE
jgi:hypothetical protein